MVNPRTDDWEPAIAADPAAPFVHVMVTRFGEPKPCQGHCPTPFIVLEVSSDGGATWSEGRPICACRGASGQFDPIIEVVPTWSNTVIDTVELGEACVSGGCYDDFYAGQTGVSADADGDLAYLYVGATTAGGSSGPGSGPPRTRD